jgi:hypothetical protein
MELNKIAILHIYITGSIQAHRLTLATLSWGDTAGGVGYVFNSSKRLSVTQIYQNLFNDMSNILY